MNIIVSKEANKHRDFLRAGLVVHNEQFSEHCSYIPEDFGFSIYDDDDKLIGGAVMRVDNTNWAYIEHVYIDESCRGRDLGRKLFSKIEEVARERSCFGLRLNTLSFQARPFYEKIGFEVYGELEDRPLGSKTYMLKKLLF